MRVSESPSVVREVDVLCEQNVLEFQIAMTNVLVVRVADTCQDLREDGGSLLLRQPAAWDTLEVVEQVAPRERNMEAAKESASRLGRHCCYVQWLLLTPPAARR